MLSVCYLEEAHLGSWAFKYQQNHQCVHVFVSITESWQKAMVYRINTISFFFQQLYTSKVNSKEPRGICPDRSPWGQSLLWQLSQHRNPHVLLDATNGSAAHILSSPTSLSTRVAWKVLHSPDCCSTGHVHCNSQSQHEWT